MFRLVFISFIFLLTNVRLYAQEDEFRRAYNDFNRQAKQEYEDFRSRANKEYAEFVRQAWEWHKKIAPMPRPKDEMIPPVVIRDEDNKRPKEDNPVVIEDVIDVPSPKPQPKPVSPIKEQPDPIATNLHFTLYGTEMTVRVNNEMKFHLRDLKIESIAEIWENSFSTNDYNNLIRDCLENRIRYQLSDWAYLKMLKALSEDFLGRGTNEAELLKAYLYCQSGYQMKLAIVDGNLCMLFSSQHLIFELPGLEIDGQIYYAEDIKGDQVLVCPASFPQEQPLSLLINNEQKFAYSPSEKRIIASEDADWLSIRIAENLNTIEFCNDYPTSSIGEDFMTRWAMYANTPFNANIAQSLYSQFVTIFKQFKNANLKDGEDERILIPAYVDILCHWVQTAFVYEYDDKVWGHDRAFFADETLYYPYCDCEDRSILLTRMVRDLLGLKCALVYYPGHLATAIAMGENVKGDFIRIDGVKYLVCDPTYIGASIGMTMPEMDNKSAKVIVLK